MSTHAEAQAKAEALARVRRSLRLAVAKVDGCLEAVEDLRADVQRAGLKGFIAAVPSLLTILRSVRRALGTCETQIGMAVSVRNAGIAAVREGDVRES